MVSIVLLVSIRPVPGIGMAIRGPKNKAAAKIWNDAMADVIGYARKNLHLVSKPGVRCYLRVERFRPSEGLFEPSRLVDSNEADRGNAALLPDPAFVMLPETQQDEHLQVLEENRLLRTTIAEVRAALGMAQQDQEKALQNAARESALEVAQLRETVSAMREQMERLEQDKSQALQQAAADDFNSMREYIAIIKTQRDEIALLVEAHAAEMQQLRRDARDEHSVLEQTIAALREQLENQRDPS